MSIRYYLLAFTITWSCFSHAESTAEKPAEALPEKPLDYQLVLAGGALKTCSSMAPNNCKNSDWIDLEKFRTTRYIGISDTAIVQLLDNSLWPKSRHKTRDELAEALKTVADYLHNELGQNERVTAAQFSDAFKRQSTEEIYYELSDAEWNRVVDHLELPVPRGQREHVRLELNKNKASVAIVERFVELAEQANNNPQPNILVVTASSRDPLDAVDFYLDLFAQAGAKTTWLPVDAALVAAQQNNDCANLDAYRAAELGSWQRARVQPRLHQRQLEFCKNPEQAKQLLAKANGIFFNGGDQSLTRKAFINADNQATELLQMIHTKVLADQLVLGGTSAGTAVMTGKPMISNGSSRSALIDGAIASEPPSFGCNRDGSCPRNTHQDSLTYHPLGGLGLFEYGIIDTHFSERGRQARLLELVAETGAPLGVGIDETTALLVNVHSDQVEVLGERGVFFITGAKQSDSAVAANFHYLVNGSSATLRAEEFNSRGLTDVTLSTTGSVVDDKPTTDFMNARGIIDSLRGLCQTQDQISLVNDEFSAQIQMQTATQVQLSGTECQVLNGIIGLVYQPAKLE